MGEIPIDEKEYSTHVVLEEEFGKIDQLWISRTGPWMVTYTQSNGILAAWQILEEERKVKDIELKYRWFAELGCFATITISHDGVYAAGYFDVKKACVI